MYSATCHHRYWSLRKARIDSQIFLKSALDAEVSTLTSVDAFKRLLLAAKSIAYSASASGVYLSTELFQRLGIADRVLAKSRKVQSEPVGAGAAS